TTTAALTPGGVALVRRTFEEVVSSCTGRSCPLLWRLYLRFELQQEYYARAKKLFYRAVASCPSSKALWLDAFLSLRRLFTAKEKKEMKNLMGRKGLLVRIETA
ncbi:hypothetical protein VYU27_010095, partial [Nannochloropsis oceanica]